MRGECITLYYRELRYMIKRILVVDDEKNIRLMIGRCLADSSYSIEQANSAEEALEHLALYDYDLMLLDLRLPGMDGMELLAQMKDLGILTPTVIISAHGTVDAAVKLMKSGVLDFLEKPFSPDELRQIVAKYLQ